MYRGVEFFFSNITFKTLQNPQKFPQKFKKNFFSTIKTYGEKNEKFIFMQALVFFQCICNLLLATIVKNNGAKTAIIMDNVPSFMYSICSISYFLAMLFSNMALEWVNYPTQVFS